MQTRVLDISDPQRLQDALKVAMEKSASEGAILELRDSGKRFQASVGGEPDGLYAIGSPTKVMTAVMIMQLVGAGHIGLDDPVTEWIPAFQLNPTAESDQVTVRHLLSHSSGIDCADDFTDTGDDDDALERFVNEVVAGAGLLHKPGRYWSYCNAGFSVLGRLVEVIDRRPWDDAFIDRIANPLGLTARPLPRANDAQIVQGHRFDQERGAVVPESRMTGRNGGPAGGNMLASAADLAEFAQALFDGKERLLSNDLSSEMIRPKILASDRQQGLAWASTHPGMVSHNGITFGHSSYMTAVPSSGQTFGLALDGPGATEVAGSIIDTLFGIEPASQTHQAEMPSVDPRRCHGEYRRRHVVQDVEFSEGQLFATTRYSGAVGEFFSNPATVELNPIGGNTFVSDPEDGSAPLRWSFEEDGESGTPRLLMAANRLHARLT